MKFNFKVMYIRPYKNIFDYALDSASVLGRWLVLFTLCTLLTGCRGEFTDTEIKGILTVDKTQYGNAQLEFEDSESNLIRFIHPGRKIIEISQGPLTFKLTLKDSGGAKLGQLHIPMKDVNTEENSFFVKGQDIKQAWDIRGKRHMKVLTIEYIARTGFEPCRIGKEEGVTAKLWKVTDVRYDYTIDFLNEVNQRPIGHFEALGAINTLYEKIDVKECLRKKEVIENVVEAFE